MTRKFQKPQIQISSENQTQNHTRINNSVINRLEKKTLNWLAARMPDWIVPDTLTFIGLFASFLIFACYSLTYFSRDFLWLASFGFIIQWFGDSLDGTLARYRKIERPRYGFFVDHIIDSISEVLIFLGLGLSPFLRFDLALIALVCYLLASVYVYLNTYVNGIFRISYAGISPTEMRLLAIVINTVIYFSGNPPIVLPQITITLFDLIMIFVIVIILSLFIYSTITTAMTLSKEDREKNRRKKQHERRLIKDQKFARKSSTKTARNSGMNITID